MFIFTEDNTEIINSKFIISVSIVCAEEDITEYEVTAITTDGQTILLQAFTSLEEAKKYLQEVYCTLQP